MYAFLFLFLASSAWAGGQILAPGKVHEDCLALKVGQSLEYWYRSKGPLDFNIHFHEGSEVTYPVKVEQQSGSSGIFAPKSAQEYCLMWTNKGKKPVSLNYGFKKR